MLIFLHCISIAMVISHVWPQWQRILRVFCLYRFPWTSVLLIQRFIYWNSKAYRPLIWICCRKSLGIFSLRCPLNPSTYRCLITYWRKVIVYPNRMAILNEMLVALRNFEFWAYSSILVHPNESVHFMCKSIFSFSLSREVDFLQCISFALMATIGIEVLSWVDMKLNQMKWIDFLCSLRCAQINYIYQSNPFVNLTQCNLVWQITDSFRWPECAMRQFLRETSRVWLIRWTKYQ